MAVKAKIEAHTAEPGLTGPSKLGERTSTNTLLQRQWVGYSTTHQNKSNLLLHLLAVPLFMAGTLVVLYGLVTLSPVSLVIAIIGLMGALFLQGCGHSREPVQPEPFSSRWDFMSRIVAEQWMTFPRFVVTGGWLKNISQPSPENGDLGQEDTRGHTHSINQ
jgi:hypothetical protein